MNVNRTALFAALLAAGIATNAFAQSTAPSGGTAPGKSSAPAPAPAATAPAPPSAGSTGMDKGAGTGAAASGATTSSAKVASGSSLPRSERRFIEKAAQGGNQEVEMSKLAMDKAQNAQVKAFAKRLVDDHTAANAALMKIATAKGVSPPATVDGGHQRKMDRMAKKSGADFDREYMDDMVDHHQKDVRDFRSMAKSAKDPDLKAFAAKTLPTLEEHLQMAKTTEAAVKKSSRKPTTAGSGGSTMTSGATTGAGPSGTAKSTATPGKDTAATTGTAGPGTGMPTSSTQSTGTAPQPPGSASDKKLTAPTK